MTRRGLWQPAGCVAVVAMTLGGCARGFSFANRTDGPVVVSVALREQDGVLEQASGALVDPGTQVDLWINHAGPATASIWKGELQLGPAAATIDLADTSGSAWDIQPGTDGVAVVPTRR